MTLLQFVTPRPPLPFSRTHTQVIVEAVPDSFVPSQMPDKDNKEKGFWEIFFGHNPNKGKVRRRCDECRLFHFSPPLSLLPSVSFSLSFYSYVELSRD